MLSIRFHGRGGQGAKTDGEVTHTYVLKRKPVEEYLKLQGRFRHLFEPARQEEAIRHIQERVDAYWQSVEG
ncbi:hypothetical protein [Nitrospira moscoviensis]|uniref:Uncharacterized protein n=1 Tax=Nitrospira moscoviensis TaxID=42253 RepID=A0A0K2GI89_NITMO|nr:hypothetical protein [Nitrospira moscoviensis]ALA60332.1 hypothetical protein NITMOv2_3947 [Nitrospira moscoviensis]